MNMRVTAWISGIIGDVSGPETALVLTPDGQTPHSPAKVGTVTLDISILGDGLAVEAVHMRTTRERDISALGSINRTTSVGLVG